MDSKVLVAFFLFCIPAGFVTAQSGATARQEAREYFAASYAHLTELSDYDVSIRMERTMVVDGMVVPHSTGHWRLRLDKQKGFYLFASLDRRISATDAAEGRLDQWHVRGSVLIVQGGEAKTHILGEGVGTDTYPSFEEAYDKINRPELGYVGTGEFTLVCLDPKSQKIRLSRVLSAADDVSVSTVNKGEGCLIRGIFKDWRAIESHSWQYSTESLCPERYTIRVEPRLLGKTLVDFDQTLKWADHAKLGWVPVTIESSQPVRLNLKAKDGTPKYVPAERLDDVTLDWKPSASYAPPAKLVKTSYTLMNVHDIVELEKGAQ